MLPEYEETSTLYSYQMETKIGRKSRYDYHARKDLQKLTRKCRILLGLCYL